MFITTKKRDRLDWIYVYTIDTEVTLPLIPTCLKSGITN